MNRKKHLLIGPLVFLLALSAVFLIRTGVSAASEYEAEDLFRENGMAMDVTYGYDGNAKGGRYIPVDVLLSNDGEKDFSGEVQILTMESDYEIYRYDYPVEVPAGSDGDLHVYIPLGNRADQMFVTLLDQEKESLGHKRVKLNFSLDVPELFIGVLSDTPEKLESWDGVGVDYSMLRTRTVNFDTDTFPSDEMGLDMIDVLLISNYRIRDLSEEQSRVLVDWVRRGGTMILGTGMRVDDTLGRFAPELLEESYEAPQVRTVSFGMQYASDNPSDAELEVPCVDFALSGGNILMSDEERTLLASVTYSQGTIAVAAFDFTDIESFCRTSPAFLDDLLTAVLGEETISSLAEAAYSGNSDANGPSVHVHDVLGNDQTQAGSAGIGGTGLLHPVELFKQQRQFFLGNHIAVVGDRNRHHRIGGLYLHQHPFAFRAVFDGVVDQIVKQPRQQIAVGLNHLGRYIALQFIGQMFFHEIGIKFLQQLA